MEAASEGDGAVMDTEAPTAEPATTPAVSRTDPVDDESGYVTAPPLPADELYVLGLEGDQMVRRHRSQRPLYANGFIFEPGTEFLIYEWATIPNSIFTKKPRPDGYVAQVHCSGKRVRILTLGKKGVQTWRVIEGWLLHVRTLENGNEAKTGRRKFMLNSQMYSASRLVALAFLGSSRRRCDAPFCTLSASTRTARRRMTR